MGRPSKKQKPTAASKNLSWEDAIHTVLSEAGQRSTTPKSRSVSYLTDYETPLVPYP